MNELEALLKRHVVKGAYYSKDLLPGGLQLESAFNSPSSLLLVHNTSQLMVNDSAVVNTDLLVRNGVMHYIDRVLGPMAMSAQSSSNLNSNQSSQSNSNSTTSSSSSSSPFNGGYRLNGNLENQLAFNSSSKSFAPAADALSLNASSLGCASNEKVCSVVDFVALQCAFQRGFMTDEQRRSCPDASSSSSSNSSMHPFTYPQTAGQQLSIEIPFNMSCYDPTQQVCVNNYALCPFATPALCGALCYDPTSSVCYESFDLCPTSKPLRVSSV